MVTIDRQLRLLFFGLECAAAVSFDAAEMERVFHDAQADQVSPKEYTFYTGPRLRITGEVAEYEPETLTLCVEGRRSLERALDGIVERAGHYGRRLDVDEGLAS